MNRVVEQASAGVEWQPDTINSYSSADRTVKKAYEANGPDEVLMWFFQYPVDESALGLPSATSAESPSGPAYFLKAIFTNIEQRTRSTMRWLNILIRKVGRY